MIRLTELVTYVVSCDDCGHEELVTMHRDATACDAEEQIRYDGWNVADGHLCLSCNPDHTPIAPVSVDDLEPAR